jgi:hypothetical protein
VVEVALLASGVFSLGLGVVHLLIPRVGRRSIDWAFAGLFTILGAVSVGTVFGVV